MLKTSKPVIFDLDGTLVKTQREFHAQAEVAVLAKHGIIMSPNDITARFSGVHTLEVFKTLAPLCDEQQLLEEKWALMFRLARVKPIEPVWHARRLVKELHQRDVPLAIASASPLMWINKCLGRTGMAHCFDCRTSVDEVKSGKPAPDVFILAAKRLGYAPKDCIAIEDGRAGVHAALAAEMETYWLTDSDETIPGATKITSLRHLLTVGDEHSIIW